MNEENKVEYYLAKRFRLLYKIQNVLRSFWPSAGRELEDILEFSRDLAKDGLSGFFVSKIFHIHLNELIAPIAVEVLSGTSRKKIVLVMIDLAMLNLANKNGHAAGDNYILRVAAALKVTERDLYDIGAERVFIGRLGGDEFGLVVVGLKKTEVETVIRKAQLEVAKTDLEHIDCGIADLTDPPKISQQRVDKNEILVPFEPGRGAVRAAVRRLELIADERASIAKAAARIDLLARLLAFAPEAYEEVCKFGLKAVSTVEETDFMTLAEKLRNNEDIWLDVLTHALRVRRDVMQGDPFKQAVSRVAELDFIE